MKTLFNPIFFAFATLLGGSLAALAAPIASDDFNSYTLGALSPQNGGTGWFAAGWTAPTSPDTTATVADVSGNKKVTAALTVTSSQVVAGRRLAAPLTSTFYVSYKVAYTGPGNVDNSNTFGLIVSDLTTPSASVGANVLNFNMRSSNVGGDASILESFAVRGGTGPILFNTQTTGPDTITPGTVYTLLAKLTWSGTNFDKIDLWVNPSGSTETTPDATLSLTAGTGVTAVNSLYFRQAANETNDTYQFDDLAVASAWTDVVPNPNSISKLVMVDAETNNDLGSFLDGSVINLATLSSPLKVLNVRAETSPAAVGSVRFGYDADANYSTDNTIPYAFAGDLNGLYEDWRPTVGAHTITATSWGGADASGTPGATSTVNFTVINDANAQAVTRFVLVNSDNDQDLFDVTDGMVINLAILPTANLSVRAETTPATVGSVRIAFDANANAQTETSAPYVLGGNSGADYLPYAPLATLGNHTMLGTPFTGAGATGSAGATLGVRFSVINVSIGNPPTVNAGQDQTLILPINSATLTAVATDNNPIQSYAWTQVSGPSTATLSGVATTTLGTSNLIEGVYVFRIVVTDSDNQTVSDEVAVNVISQGIGTVDVAGELKKWHKVTLVCGGPATNEKAGTNPFTAYRLNATFTHPGSGKTYVVPGYYAADGNAANTSASAGNKWHVHFAPDEIGTWNYTLSFRTGPGVAIDPSPTAGASAAYFDNATGSFAIVASDKLTSDNRAKGRLQYVGKHHLRYAETGEYFLKVGTDSPENLLAYDDIDNTPNAGNRRKAWTPHAGDYNAAEGSPFTWTGGKGTELIGAMRYLALEGINAFSFLTFSLDGDDDNVFPHLLTGTVAAYEAVGNDGRWSASTPVVYKDRFDVSKMAQWENLFSYGDQLGMYLHFKTQETENDQRMDGGALGPERKIYYRELVARFGHHLALNWNLGEETTNTEAQARDFAQWFHDNDPYRHLVVLHTYPGEKNRYTPLLGTGSKLTGVSLQSDPNSVFSDTKSWRDQSAAASRPWVVANDEQGSADVGIAGDSIDPAHNSVRANVLWGNIMAGGAGIEAYFGYNSPSDQSDLTLQDFRSRDLWWDQNRHSLGFFKNHQIPFWDMGNADSLVSGSGNTANHGLAKIGESYVVYLKIGGTHTLNLSAVTGNYEVRWYDPRNGGNLQTTATATIAGAGVRSLGVPPSSTTSDWIVLVRLIIPPTPYQSWLDTFPALSAPNDKLPGADPDNDQLENIGEFAFDGNPSSGADAGKISSSITDTTADANNDKELVLTLAVRNGAIFTAEPTGSLVGSVDGVAYKIEGTVNLTVFDQAVEEVTPSLSAGLLSSSTGWSYRSFRLPATDGTSGKAFIRASAASSP